MNGCFKLHNTKTDRNEWLIFVFFQTKFTPTLIAVIAMNSILKQCSSLKPRYRDVSGLFHYMLLVANDFRCKLTSS